MQGISSAHRLTLLPASQPYRVGDLPDWLARRVTIDEQSGCWRVGGFHDDDGYTYYHTGKGRIRAHRFAWTHLVGPIPEDRPVLDHVRSRGCVFRDCIWPLHLEPVTVRINTLRGSGPAAVNYFKPRCSTCNTEFDLLNCYIDPTGRQHCRKCNRAAVERYKKRQREKFTGPVTAVTELRPAA